MCSHCHVTCNPGSRQKKYAAPERLGPTESVPQEELASQREGKGEKGGGEEEGKKRRGGKGGKERRRRMCRVEHYL